ncbi:hypothetical protein BJX66DRAFT_289002 [Aspergillus keveii]|uniref:Uncharacterized protein n=1 Tax=Aspergillus keveii TaxID=714993 RepID=A0ABR4GQE0_9EURO
MAKGKVLLKALEYMENLYHKALEQKATPEEKKEHEAVTGLVRSLSQKGASLAIGDFEEQMLMAIFGVREATGNSPSLKISRKELICLPIPLETVLTDFETVTRGSKDNETKLRSRFDVIFYLTHADTQRSAYYRNNELITPRVAQHIDEVHFATEKQISQTITYQQAQRHLNGFMDYTLWWGHQDDLETNLVVVEAKALGGASLGMKQALVSMAMIHSARKKSGKKDCRIFGIGTDSFDFFFLAIDNDSTWGSHYVRWRSTAEKIEIVSRIAKMIREAAALVPTSNRASIDSADSVRSQTGCKIEDVAMKGVEEEEEEW